MNNVIFISIKNIGLKQAKKDDFTISG